jgi:predicted secreted hydrolase
MCLCLFTAAAWAAPASNPQPVYPVVVPGAELRFPRDHGAHSAYRTEWWYLTGWLDAPMAGRSASRSPSFARAQGLIPPTPVPSRRGRSSLHTLHFRTLPEAGSFTTSASHGRASGSRMHTRVDARIALLDWSLERRADGVFYATIRARDFTFGLAFTPTQPVMLNGERGYSRKGPLPEQASYYFLCRRWRSRAV